MKKMVTQGVRALCLTMLLSGISASAQRITTRRAHVDDQTKMTRIISCAGKAGERLEGFKSFKGFERFEGSNAISQMAKADGRRRTADVDLMNEVLIDEDFSLFAAGTEETPDGTCLCVLDGTKESPKIDNQYTHQPGWTGGRVYQAGGMVALIPADEGLSAVLNSPYGDYSGNLTVTFRMKSIDPSGRTYFFLNCLRNGIDAPRDCVDKDGKYVYYKYNLKNEEGWKEFTIDFNNCSADWNSFLQFNCAGQVLLDDFKVVAHNDFIAAPCLRQAKDFTYDGFTATWDKMRVAESYDVKAYYKKYSDKEEEVFTANFEDGVDDGFILIKHGDKMFTEDGGFEGSKGIILQEGDTLIAPSNSALIKSMKLYINYVKPDDVEWDYYSCLNIQGYDPKYDRWIDGGVWCEDLQDYVPDVFDCERDFFDFNNWFQMVRLIPETMPEGSYVVVDNIEIVTNQPFEYVQDGETYTTTGNEVKVKTSWPEETYYYKVTAHLNDMEGTSGLIEAIGVATPHTMEATDVDERGSYTANWEAAPRATGYIIDNFGVFTATEECDYALVSENFDKIDESVTEAGAYTDFESLGNYSYTSLDKYTQFPGWIGINNVVSKGMIGCASSEDAYALLYTPLICAEGCDSISVTVKAYGKAGDYLLISNSEGNFGIPFMPIEGDEKNGIIDGTFNIPAADVNEMLCLLSFNSQAFLIDEFTITRHLQQGEKAEVFLSEAVEEGNGVTSHVFDNLDSYPYGEYAYSVTACLYHEGNDRTYMSEVSDMVYVNLSQTEDAIRLTDSLAGGNADVEIYDINGRRIKTANISKGVYIMRNGNEVRKIIIKDSGFKVLGSKL